jgi:hypothetical protein
MERLTDATQFVQATLVLIAESPQIHEHRGGAQQQGIQRLLPTAGEAAEVRHPEAAIVIGGGIDRRELLCKSSGWRMRTRSAESAASPGCGASRIRRSTAAR